ncbi:MAG: hypothetical protein JO038_01260 [Alphaproteobacteria bacterium]|nr:hypothetical protein [Alphaproteobacteria bacterium]
MIFFVRAEPLEGPGQHATAVVVAEDAEEAVLLLRKDFDFSGYKLPPLEIRPHAADSEQVRRALGDAASQEKGVYGFAPVEGAGPPPH